MMRDRSARVAISRSKHLPRSRPAISFQALHAAPFHPPKIRRPVQRGKDLGLLAQSCCSNSAF
jgi:hypothetical protein